MKNFFLIIENTRWLFEKLSIFLWNWHFCWQLVDCRQKIATTRLSNSTFEWDWLNCGKVPHIMFSLSLDLFLELFVLWGRQWCLNQVLLSWWRRRAMDQWWVALQRALQGAIFIQPTHGVLNIHSFIFFKIKNMYFLKCFDSQLRHEVDYSGPNPLVVYKAPVPRFSC